MPAYLAGRLSLGPAMFGFLVGRWVSELALAGWCTEPSRWKCHRYRFWFFRNRMPQCECECEREMIPFLCGAARKEVLDGAGRDWVGAGGRKMWWWFKKLAGWMAMEAIGGVARRQAQPGEFGEGVKVKRVGESEMVKGGW